MQSEQSRFCLATSSFVVWKTCSYRSFVTTKSKSEGSLAIQINHAGLNNNFFFSIAK